ncbi:hypothetical protein QE152_g13175 [Popillia japonica]|uniref:Uncharacterized protein n=1 Tax=Popillia japonica TaxID=7064 RepID=A0AAW1LF96_POPJA
MEMCDPSVNYPLMMTNEIRTEGDKQFLSGKGDFKVDFGANSEYKITVNIKKTRDAAEFAPLISFEEPDTCAAIQKYLGDFFNELEKSAGIESGKCPIEKGTYELKDYPLDFKKLAYQSVPEGILQTTQIITDKTTKEVLLCLVTEGENFPK